MSDPRAHAEYSPSSFAYRKECHFWQPIPQSEQNPMFAIEGEKLHAAVQPDQPLEGLDPEQQKMVLDIRSNLEPILDYAAKNKGLVTWEPRIEILDQWGFADLFIRVPTNEGHLFDFKFGLIEVDEATENFQLMAYAFGLFDAIKDLNSITTYILQPRLAKWSEKIYTREKDFPVLEATVRAILENAKNPTRYCKGEQCLYCGNRARCPELLNLQQDLLALYEPEVRQLAQVGFHSSDVTEGRQAFVMLELARIAMLWGESVRKHITEKTMSGNLVPEGYMLASRRGEAKPIQGSIALQALGSVIDPNEFLEHVKIDLSSLVQLARAKAPRGQKGHVEDELTTRLNELGLINRADEITYLRRIRNFVLPGTVPSLTNADTTQ